MTKTSLILALAFFVATPAHAYKVRKECEDIPTKQGTKTRCKSVYDAEATERWREEQRLEREAAKQKDAKPDGKKDDKKEAKKDAKK